MQYILVAAMEQYEEQWQENRHDSVCGGVHLCLLVRDIGLKLRGGSGSIVRQLLGNVRQYHNALYLSVQNTNNTKTFAPTVYRVRFTCTDLPKRFSP